MTLTKFQEGMCCNASYILGLDVCNYTESVVLESSVKPSPGLAEDSRTQALKKLHFSIFYFSFLERFQTGLGRFMAAHDNMSVV